MEPSAEEKLMAAVMRNKPEDEKQAVESAMQEISKLIDEILENPENPNKIQEA